VRYRADLGGFAADAAGPGTIPAAAMEWLRYTGRIGFEAACQVGLEPEGRNLLLRLCLDLAAEQIGGRLQSLQGQEFLFFS
jgi:hypothetical protein